MRKQNHKSEMQRVMEAAEDFPNVKKYDKQWRGHNVYYPCGPNGEVLYIGTFVCFVVFDDVIEDFYGIKAKQILEEMYGKDDEEDEEPDDDEEIAPEDIYNS